MKTSILLSAAALGLAACGTGASDRVWTTDDLRCVPLISGEETLAYVDTQTGKEVGAVQNGSLFFDGCALAFSDDGSWYYMDRDLTPVTGEMYRQATNYSEGIAWVAKPGCPLTAIDRKGRMLFELRQAEAAYAFHEGLAVFCNAEGLWGLVDKKGCVVAEPQWDAVGGTLVVGGLLPVWSKVKDKLGIANRKGELVVDYRFEKFVEGNRDRMSDSYVQAFLKKRIPFEDASGKWGVIDAEGNCLINPQFDEIHPDGDDYMFRKGRLVGWCDKEGKYLINPQFRDAYPFGGNDLAPVENKEREWGCIDKEGEWVVEAQFAEIKPFLACGIAPAKDADSREWGAIDKTGRWVVNPQFREMYAYGAGDKWLVEDQTGKFGIVGADGRYVIAPMYDSAPKYLLENVSGISLFERATSDYVDVAHYAELIAGELLSLKASTVGALKTAYGLKESKFPKNGGEMTLCKKKLASDMTAQVEIVGIHAWSRKSDGWFGYTYTFLPDTPVGSYTFVVKFDGKGRAWRFVEEIFGELKKKYAFDEQTGCFTVPGYSLVFGAAIPNGGMVFQVKPE